MSEQPANAPTDAEVVSVPLEDEDGTSSPVANENVASEDLAGGGEWPATDAEPRGPAPGTEPADRERIERSRVEDADARDDPEGFKDVLDRDRIAGGSKSTPD